MRLLVLSSALLALPACAFQTGNGHPPGIHQDHGDYYQWYENGSSPDSSNWPETTWTYRGTYTVDDVGGGDDPDGSGDTGTVTTGSWTGTEETVVTVRDDVDCHLSWRTLGNHDLDTYDGLCPDCDAGWSVTCDSGHVADGENCDQYFAPAYYETPMTFDMAFSATGPADDQGVTPGVVLFRDPASGMMGWYEAAPATFDGHTMRYEISVQE